MGTKRDGPYTLKRFIVRIAIPIAIVSLIIAIARFIMLTWFYEENVRPSETQEVNPEGG